MRSSIKGYGVYGQPYDADEKVMGVEFQINTHPEDDSERTCPRGNGGHVRWRSCCGLDIIGPGRGNLATRKMKTVFKPGGSTNSPSNPYLNPPPPRTNEELRVNTRQNDKHTTPSVTALFDGGFVVTLGIRWSGRVRLGHICPVLSSAMMRRARRWAMNSR